MAVSELPLAYHQQTHLSERSTFLACLKSVRFSLVILYESPIIDYNPMVDCCVMQTQAGCKDVKCGIESVL